MPRLRRQLLTTDCKPEQLSFQGWGEGSRREVRLDFEGGRLTSDAGVVGLGEVERRRRILARFAACFEDHRNPALVEHALPTLVAQRVLGLAMGYEDLNDHDQLRVDALLVAGG